MIIDETNPLLRKAGEWNCKLHLSAFAICELTNLVNNQGEWVVIFLVLDNLRSECYY